MAYTVEKDIDGETREIEVSEDELGDDVRVLSDDQIGPGGDYLRKDYFEQEMHRRTKGKIDRDDARDELLDDDDFVNAVLDEHGTDDERVQKLQAQNEKLKTSLSEATDKLDTLQQKSERQSVEQAAREADIDSRFLDAPTGKAPIHAMLDGRTERTDDGTLVPLDDDGNRIPAPPDSDATYATLEDYFERDEWDEYRADTPKTKGSGFGGSGSGGSQSWSDLSAEERSDMSLDEKVDAIKAEHS